MSPREGRYIHGTHVAEQRRLTRMQELLNGTSLRELALKPGDRVLDMGCGLAHFARAMARVVGPGGRVVGVEGSEEQITEAARLAQADGEASLVDLRRGEATDPPLEASEWGTFDVVHARFLLEHVPDPGAVVRCMVRAARPGGRIVLEDDDHADLRLHPELPGFAAVWEAYMNAYKVVGAEPLVGRHLVSLLAQSGAAPHRTTCLFFGGCQGQPRFPLLADNFVGVIESARKTMIEERLIGEHVLDEGLAAFQDWARLPDATLWYATSWAEGRRPFEADDPTTDGRHLGGQEVAAHARVRDALHPPRDPAIDTTSDEVDWLKVLVTAAEDFNSTLEIDAVLQRVASRVRSLVDCHLFCVLLWDEERDVLDHSFSMRFDEHVELGRKGGFPLGHGIGGSAAATRRAIRVPDVSRDPRYVRFRHAEVDIRSELAVPLLVRGRLVGVLDLESMDLDAFTHEHEQLLKTLASQIANALENARLYEEVRRHEQRIQQEIDEGREIQSALLGDGPPDAPGLDIGWVFEPARELGGDLFDFVLDRQDRLVVSVGDVAGKATPAALYGSLALGLLRSQVREGKHEAADILRLLNTQLCRLRIEDRFLALCLAVIDGASRTVTLANAGLPRPYLLSGGRAHRVDILGLALGIEGGSSYEHLTLKLDPGDALVLCSDGLEECRDLRGELYGAPRLEACLETCADNSAQAMADALLESTEEFARGTDRTLDDRTVVVVRTQHSPPGESPDGLHLSPEDRSPS